MRLDEQVAEVERETDACLDALRRKLQGVRFQRLGNRQFEDVGRVYERRGAPATRVFVQSKIRGSRREEQEEYRRLLDIIGLVSEKRLDVHLKAFILRKLPSIFPEHFR